MAGSHASFTQTFSGGRGTDPIVAMIITCPSCLTSYQLAADALHEEGRRVKCARCGHRWTARKQVQDEDDSVVKATVHDIAAIPDDFEAFPQALRPDLPLMEGEPTRMPAHETAGAVSQTDIEAGIDIEPDVDIESDIAGDDDAANDEQDAVEALFGQPMAPSLAPGADIESLAARTTDDAQERAGRRRALFSWRRKAPAPPVAHAVSRAPRGSRAIRYAAVLCCLAALAGALVLARHPVVAALPGTAGLYAAVGLPVNLRGLEFRNVTFEQGFEDGLPVLAIRGEVVNITSGPVMVPDIRYGLRDGMRNEIYSWSGQAQAERLAPRASAPFVTRLQSPPAGATQALVRFTGPVGGRR